MSFAPRPAVIVPDSQQRRAHHQDRPPQQPAGVRAHEHHGPAQPKIQVGRSRIVPFLPVLKRICSLELLKLFKYIRCLLLC